ncbi:MAG: prolyl oligopeptidase family serine peptidase [Actinomycetota bacterium]|nr:prolyl oligopeptidase family serine peptidase [Actinomycetota bacterium]
MMGTVKKWSISAVLVLLLCFVVLGSSFVVTRVGSGEAFAWGRRAPYSSEDVTFKNSKGYKIAGTLYWPTKQGTYPGVVFIGGFSSHRGMYAWIPETLASNGYVALSIDGSGNGASEGAFGDLIDESKISSMMLDPASWVEGPVNFILGTWKKDVSDAITYLTEKSKVRGMVDKNRIGISGHSMGGMTVSWVPLADSRVKAIVAFSDVIPIFVDDYSIPLQIQTGDLDLVLNDNMVAIPGYKAAKAPKEIIYVEGGTHDGFTNIAIWPKPPWQHDVSSNYFVAWFNSYLKGDASAHEVITSKVRHLSRIHRSEYNLGNGDSGILGGPRR